jgi:hypothetical protein
MEGIYHEWHLGAMAFPYARNCSTNLGAVEKRPPLLVNQRQPEEICSG